MTRDELIEELQQCPYDTEVVFKVKIADGFGGERVIDNLKITDIRSLPSIKIELK